MAAGETSLKERHEAALRKKGRGRGQGPLPKRAIKRQSKRLLRPKIRTNNAEATKQDILDAATEEFAAHGLSGARVDAISERTKTSKRMIYYYFGGKLGLYRSVLARSYADIREAETDLGLETLDPREAIRRLIETTFDYDNGHPDFIRLVSIENIHRAKNLAKVPLIKETGLKAIATIGGILDRGKATGVFREDIAPLDLHLLISSFCFFRVSNRYTFGEIFSVDISEVKRREGHKRIILEAILGMLRPEVGAEKVRLLRPASRKA